MLRQIESMLFENLLPLTVYIPYQQGQLISFHEQGRVGRNISESGYLRNRLHTRRLLSASKLSHKLSL